MGNDPLVSACKRERKFQDAKTNSLRAVHEVLNNPEFSPDEKYMILTTELGFGKIRAQQLVYGSERYDWRTK